MTDTPREIAKAFLDDEKRFLRDPVAGVIPMHFNALYDELTELLTAQFKAGQEDMRDRASAFAQGQYEDQARISRHQPPGARDLKREYATAASMARHIADAIAALQAREADHD